MNYEELRDKLSNLIGNKFDSFKVSISETEDNTILISKKIYSLSDELVYIAEVAPNSINNFIIGELSKAEIDLIINFSKQSFSSMVDLPITCTFKRSYLKAAYEELINISGKRDMALEFKRWSEIK